MTEWDVCEVTEQHLRIQNTRNERQRLEIHTRFTHVT